MGDLGGAFASAAHMILARDPALLGIVLLSLRISLTAVLCAALIGLPLGGALTRQVIEELWQDYRDPLRSLGAGPARAIPTLLWDARVSLATAVLAGFGRASAEVGAIMIVGGNIAGVTRTMTTAIALETSKGDLALALGLGIVLLTLTLAVNAVAHAAGHAAARGLR